MGEDKIRSYVALSCLVIKLEHNNLDPCPTSFETEAFDEALPPLTQFDALELEQFSPNLCGILSPGQLVRASRHQGTTHRVGCLLRWHLNQALEMRPSSANWPAPSLVPKVSELNENKTYIKVIF